MQRETGECPCLLLDDVISAELLRTNAAETISRSQQVSSPPTDLRLRPRIPARSALWRGRRYSDAYERTTCLGAEEDSE
jgi:hypothetical protein